MAKHLEIHGFNVGKFYSEAGDLFFKNLKRDRKSNEESKR